jgi:hypothetical protein
MICTLHAAARGWTSLPHPTRHTPACCLGIYMFPCHHNISPYTKDRRPTRATPARWQRILSDMNSCVEPCLSSALVSPLAVSVLPQVLRCTRGLSECQLRACSARTHSAHATMTGHCCRPRQLSTCSSAPRLLDCSQPPATTPRKSAVQQVPAIARHTLPNLARVPRSKPHRLAAVPTANRSSMQWLQQQRLDPQLRPRPAHVSRRRQALVGDGGCAGHRHQGPKQTAVLQRRAALDMVHTTAAGPSTHVSLQHPAATVTPRHRRHSRARHSVACSSCYRRSPQQAPSPTVHLPARPLPTRIHTPHPTTAAILHCPSSNCTARAQDHTHPCQGRKQGVTSHTCFTIQGQCPQQHATLLDPPQPHILIVTTAFHCPHPACQKGRAANTRRPSTHTHPPMPPRKDASSGPHGVAANRGAPTTQQPRL